MFRKIVEKQSWELVTIPKLSLHCVSKSLETGCENLLWNRFLLVVVVYKTAHIPFRTSHFLFFFTHLTIAAVGIGYGSVAAGGEFPVSICHSALARVLLTQLQRPVWQGTKRTSVVYYDNTRRNPKRRSSS